MEIIKKSKEEKIEIGDLIEYRGQIGILTYMQEAFVRKLTEQDLEFPYIMFDLQTGEKILAHASLEGVNSNEEIKLLAKNKDITLTY
jgi:hypothetical protein